MKLKSSAFIAAASLFIIAATAARADVTISSAATQNMVCSGGLCQPTASDAVLNTGDLETLLGAGSVKVSTTASGVQANNIDVTANFTWSANTLTLDAYQSISVAATVSVGDGGGTTILTDDGGSGGTLTFAIGRGQLSFPKNPGSLLINGKTYQLVDSLKQLAAAAVADPHGLFALSRDATAGKDNLYYNSPIPVSFDGAFNGLGHAISNIEIADVRNEVVGFFADVKRGSVASVSLLNVVVEGGGDTGALAGTNEGSISNVFVSGQVFGSVTGGLIGSNLGTLSASQSAASVGAIGGAGGIVGDNEGTIMLSFAVGKVSGARPGGVAGDNGNGSIIENSYALGSVRGKHGPVGGFIENNFGGDISASYSTGAVHAKRKNASIGGFAGSNGHEISNCYWDTGTSGTDQGSGDGNETGLTGLTTAELQSGLPAGFDPSIWGENADINNGLPYLLANPPQ